MSLDVSKLQVHPTTLCPKTLVESVERAKAINCSDTKKYICLPNEENTELFEVCFTLSTVFVKKGKKNLEPSYSNISNIIFYLTKRQKEGWIVIHGQRICHQYSRDYAHVKSVFHCC